MASLGPAGCCCTDLTCPDFVQCAPGPCIRIPSMTFRHEQRTESSACTLEERTIEVTIRDVIMVFDPLSACYVLVSAEMDVSYSDKTWGVFGIFGGSAGEIFDAADGECCPACQACCPLSENTFTATNHPVGYGISLCCIKPCGINSQPVLKLEVDTFANGTWQSWTYDATQPRGCCGPMVTDGPFSSYLDVAFRSYTPLSCNISSWFHCRTLDWNWGDNQGKNGSGWSFGRIPDTTGGNPLDEICSGEYRHERPQCLPDGEGYPTITDIDCLKAGFGVLRTHYEVCSCELDSYPSQTGSNLLVHAFTCVDSTGINFGCGTNCCCGYITKVCSDGSITGGPDCPNWAGAALACLTGCPNPYCGNSDGVLAFIYRCDKAESSFQQAPEVIACPPPMGACCIEGTCTVTTEAECDKLGGTYQGDNVPCTPVNPCE